MSLSMRAAVIHVETAAVERQELDGSNQRQKGSSRMHLAACKSLCQ